MPQKPSSFRLPSTACHHVARLLLPLVLAALTAMPALASSHQPGNFHYRIDASRDPLEVRASFSVRQDKDFAFFGLPGGRPVTELKVYDSRGARTATPTGESGVYKIDGLKAGQVTATFRMNLNGNCRHGSCRDSGGLLLKAADILLHPMGVEPGMPNPVRIDVVMPATWKLVTTGGPVEGPLRARSLSEAAAWPLLIGDLTLVSPDDTDLLVVQSTGWQVPAESVGALVAGYLNEHNRLLGNWRDGDGPRIIRVMPGRDSQASFVQAGPGLDLVRLPGAGDRTELAAAMVRPLSNLFHQRLEQGLAGASSPETQWWRAGFTEYISMLAGVRAGSLDDQVILDRLLESWVNSSRRSSLSGRISPAEAGALEDAPARRFVRDSGLLACFLLDLQIRHGSGNASGIGELLASTRGRFISNELLQQEAARLAGTDLDSFFRRAVTGTGPAPLQAMAPLGGLEMADAGTGEVFIGMSLAADEPVIARVFTSGPARARGLKAGDRILALNGEAVDSAAVVDRMLAAHAPGDALEITVRSEDGQTYTTVLDLWERVAPVLRRSRQASLAALNAWSNLVRGEATTFAN